MADYGLLGAIGQGLREGMLTYQQVKQAKDQRDMQRESLNASEMEKGLVRDDNGMLQPNPLTQAKQSAELNQYQPLTDAQRSFYGQALTVPGQQPVNVPEGMSEYQMEKSSGLLKPAISGGYMLLGKQASNNIANERLNLQKQRFGEIQSQNAGKAGVSAMHDPIIEQSQKNINSLDRAEGILTGKIPANAAMYNTAMQDMVNAFDTSGRATEGKFSRESNPTLWAGINKAQSWTGSVKDLREAQPELTQNIVDFIHEARGAHQRAIVNRMSGYKSAYGQSSNPKVGQTLNDVQGTMGAGSGLLNQTPQTQSTPTIDPDAAKSELRRRGIPVQ